MVRGAMRGLLEETIGAHGGLDAWSAQDSVKLGLRSGGLAFRSKGRPEAMGGASATIATSGQHVVFEPYPRPGERGVFVGSEAWIEDAAGSVIARTDRPRGLRWQPVDMLAFAGAALWSYISFPFVLGRPEFAVRELPSRRLEVTVGNGIVTHSGRHVLWIGDDGLIHRHDYTAEAMGRFAFAANVVLEHGRLGDLVLATRRRVTPRLLGRPLPGPTLVWIEITV
jgi:hypothetical protein